MKIFKRLALTLTALTLCFSSACLGSQPTVNSNLVAGSYWLKNSEVNGIGTINETCVYNLSFEPNIPEDKEEAFLTCNDMNGTLTTVLTNSTYEGVACYKFTTELKNSGTYYYKAQSATFNDRITSEVYFLGLGDSFTPLYSKKYLLSTAPVIVPSSDEAIFAVMEYTMESIYDRENKSATVKVTAGEASTEDFKPNDSERLYENYDKSGLYFDNESLLFIPRAADFADNGFSNSFYTIDGIVAKRQKLALTVNSSAPTSSIKLPTYTYNDVSYGETEISVYNANISIVDTFSGSTIQLYYATKTEHHRRLVQMKNQLAYSVGTIVYTLSSVSYSN